MAAAKKKPAPSEVPAPIQQYGLRRNPLHTQLSYDMGAFAFRLPVDSGCPSRPVLFRRIAERVLPGYFEWHDWTRSVVEAGCNDNLIGNPGCASSAKTHNWTGFAVAWWLCQPDQSSVMFVSTSIKSMRRRAWAQVQKCFSTVPGDRIGNFVDSRMLWQAVKGDDKHAIIGKAVEEGSTHKVADDIKGVHTRRQMVIVDEANAVPEAIWEAITNLYSYPKEFILVALANPRDRLSKFSRFIEPLDGWTSVSVETEEWEGKPQKDYGNIPVKVIRFDAEKSPNIVEGKLVSKHLPTKEKVEAAKASGGGETPSYWTNFRGFPPPEGLNKTVFSESALMANNAFGKFTFTGKNFHILGAFDPAFGGGDRPALRFAKLGMISDDKWGIEVGKPIILPINAHSTNPVHFQLAEQLRRECEKVVWGEVTYSCPPENLAVDATGEGGGLCDIIQRTWSPKIMRVEFGGAASEDSASLEDVRPANEVYENKSVEMWFRARDALNAGQLRGIDPETATEFTNRLFDDSGKRIKLQKKNHDGKDGKTKGYKQMYGKSPDLGDCFEAGTQVLTSNGIKPIETIRVGDLIVTPFGVSPVGKVHVTKTSQLTTAFFSNGSKLCGKGKHEIFTWDNGWTRLDSLVLTNTVESDSNLWIWNILNSLFTRDENTEFKAMVDIIKTKTGLHQSDFYTGLYGLSETDPFQRACAYITKMVTGLTTDWRIWKSCFLENIVPCTCEIDFRTKNIKREIQYIFGRQICLLAHGTELQKAEHGTAGTQLTDGKRKPRFSDVAPCATGNSFSGSINQESNAQASVGKRATIQVSKLTRHAPFAEIITSLTGMLRRKVVPVHVRTESGPERLVYNLTLNEHNAYYANGILVANCAVMLLEVARRKGFRLAAVGQTVARLQDWSEHFKAVQEVHATADYAPEEEGEFEYA